MLRPLRIRVLAALLAALYLAVPGGALGVRPCLHHDGLVPESAITDHANDRAGHADPDTRQADDHAHAKAAPDHSAVESARVGSADVESADASSAHDDTHNGCSCLEACAASSAIAIDAVAPVVPAADESIARVSRPVAVAPGATRPSHFLPFATAPPLLPV